MQILELLFAVFFTGMFCSGVLMFFGIALLMLNATDKTENFNPIVKPYSAESLKQSNDLLTNMTELENNSRTGRWANRFTATFTICLICLAVTVGVDFAIAKSTERPSRIFAPPSENNIPEEPSR